MLGRHAGYILAAYAITFVVIGALIVWVRVDGRARQNELEAMRRRGLRRRAREGDDT